MSTQKDTRIVEMQFDNSKFSSNVESSISALDRLKAATNMDGAAAGINTLSTSIGGIQVGGAVEGFWSLGDALQRAATVGFDTVVNRITNALFDATAAAKSFYSDLMGEGAIKSGYQEYNTQQNAIQTILANTQKEGATLDDVTGVLDDLNLYADQTIYNFTEMTRNIGTFTAAGVDLNTSREAIKGIANLAAVSGSNSEQASRAMYQLSQAIASGVVNLQDWNSVVNAGMGGQVFQDALIRTGERMGVVNKKMIEAAGGFRASISTKGLGWLTSDILVETLQTFTGEYDEATLRTMGYTEAQAKEIVKMGETALEAATVIKTIPQLIDTMKESAQSGWTQSWGYVLGDFEEAKTVLTAISQEVDSILGGLAQTRNDMLQTWHDLGGREDIIEGFSNIYNFLKTIVLTIRDAYDMVFGIDRETLGMERGLKLADLSASFREFTESLIISEDSQDAIFNVFASIFSIFNNAVPIGSKVMAVLGTIFSYIAGGVLWLASYVTPIVEDVINTVAPLFLWFFSYLSNIFAAGNPDATIVDVIIGIKDKIVDALKNHNIFTLAYNFIASFINGIKAALSTLNFDDVFDYAIIAFILVGIYKVTKSLIGLNEAFSGLLGVTKDILDIPHQVSKFIRTLRRSVTAAQRDFDVFLKSQAFLNIAYAIAAIAASIAIIAKIPTDQLYAATGVIVIIGILIVGLLKYKASIPVPTRTVIASMRATAAKILAFGLLLLGIGNIIHAVVSAIDILANDLEQYDAYDPNSPLVVAVSGLFWLTIFFVGVVAGISILAKLIKAKAKDVQGFAIILSTVAVSMILMTWALSLLSGIDGEKMRYSMAAMGLIMVCIALTVAILARTAAAALMIKNVYAKIAVAFFIIGAAITLLAVPIGALALIQAIPGVGEGLFLATIEMIMMISVIMVLFTTIGHLGTKQIEKTSTAILSWAAGMVLIGVALHIMAGLFTNDWNVILGAFSGLILMLGIMVIMLKALAAYTRFDFFLEVGISILLIAAALAVVAVALAAVSAIPSDRIMDVTGTLVIMLVALAGVMALLKMADVKPDAAINYSIAIVLLAAALVVLAYAIKEMSGLNMDDLKTAGIVMAGFLGGLLIFFLGLGVLTRFLPTVKDAILAVGGAFLMFGVGLLAIAAAMYIAKDAMPGFIDAFEYSVNRLEEMWQAHKVTMIILVVAILAVIAALTFAAPAIVSALTSLWHGIQHVFSAIGGWWAGLSDEMKGKIIKMILTIGALIGVAGPYIGKVVKMIFQNIGTFLIESLPAVASFLVDLIIAVINAVSEALMSRQAQLAYALYNLLTAIFTTAFNLVIELIAGFMDIIVSLIPGLGALMQNTMGDSWTGLAAKAGQGLNLTLKEWGSGLKELADEEKALNDSMTESTSMLDSIKDFGGNLFSGFKGTGEQSGTGLMDGILGGITSAMPDLQNGLSGVTDGIMNHQTDAINQITQQTQNGVDLNIDTITNPEAYLDAMDINMDSLETSITEGGKDAKEATEVFTDETVQIVENKKDDMQHAGKNMMLGMARGMLLAMPELNATVGHITGALRQRVATYNQEHSPSKLYMVAGSHMMEGMAIGISNGGAYVSDSVGKLLSNVYSMYQDGFDDINNISEFGTSSIRPVLDISNVNQGLTRMNGLMTEATIDGRLFSDYDTQDFEADLRYDDTGVITEVRTLKDEIARLANELTNMQMVLDTGALVGNMVDPLDEALGVRAIRRSRGN